MNTIVAKLKKRKKELKLTNKALSTTSGVPYGTVCRVFSNSSDTMPNLQTIKDMARAMDMTMEELLDSEDTQAREEEKAEEPKSPDSPPPVDEERIDARALAAMAQNYEALLDERQNMLDLKDQIIASKEKWLTRLFITCCILMGIIVAVMVFDLVNPSVGFFRR